MHHPIKTGVVGFGMSAQVFHCPFLVTGDHFKLTAVVERSGDRSREAYPWIRVAKSIDSLLADPELELIVITTPNDTHFELAKQALMAGKHVVLEKPFTVTSEEADQLISLAERHKRILTVYQNRRWDGDFLTVRQVIESGMLGELVEYEAHFDRFRNQPKQNAWREGAAAGAGILFDLGSHLLDQAQVLFGLPDSISADVRRQRTGVAADDCFDLRLDYGRLKVTVKSGMLVREQGPHFILHGTEGSFIKYGMDPQEAALKSGKLPDTADWGVEPQEQWGTLHTQLDGLTFRGQVETLPGCYAAFYQNLYEAIRHGAEIAIKPEEARNTIRMIELARESSKQKRTVQMK